MAMQYIMHFENGDKIHWQDTGGEIDLPLTITSGHNNIVLYVRDDQDILHKQVVKVFGLSEDDSEAHLEVSEEGDK